MIFVIGNGKSRLNFNLNTLSEHGILFGCNALYRDFSPDFLVSIDIPITHEIISSNYIKSNKLYTNVKNSFDENFRNHFNFDNIVENKKTDFKFLMNGKNNSNYITWFSDEDFIYDFPWDDDNWGMSAGITAIRLAHVLYPNEKIILIGFDVFGDRNNVYDGTNTYPKLGTKNTGETIEFLKGFEILTNKYKEISIERVCNDNNIIPKVKNITEKDLWQHLEIDQKI